MKYYRKITDNIIEYFSEPLIINNQQIFNPTEEQLLLAGWEEYIPEEYQPTYEERVVELIRQRYTIDDEIALLRQKDTKQDEYDAWYTYCEQCKQEART